MIRIAFGVILAFFILKSCGYIGTANAGQIGISTGPTNLVYYAIGNDIKQACPDLNINIYESKGGVSNIGNLFTRNDVQFGIAPLDTLKFKELTDKSRMNKVVVVMPLYQNAIQVIASTRSGIKTVKDLNGKRVNIGPVGSGSWVSAQLVGSRIGVTFKKSTYSTAESLKKVMNGELDAAFYFSGIPTPDLQNLGKDGDGIIRLVDMRHPNLDNFYQPTEIPENTYAWEHNAVTVQQIQNYLIAYNYGSSERQNDVTELISCIKEKLDWFTENGHPAWKGVDPTAEVKWPMHPEAKRVLNGQ